MKLVSYRLNPTDVPRAAILHPDEPAGQLIDIGRARGGRPTMLDLLQGRGAVALPDLIALSNAGAADLDPLSDSPYLIPLNSVQLTAPLPNPTSLRDFYAFEEHVRTARARRGLDMIPAWYHFPVFYFSNHQATVGPDDVIKRPAQCRWLDYELEVAAVIGKQGKDIPVDQAEEYIAGYTIMNDWSARDLQRAEMPVGLGPAKGKDFATSLGPWLVTPEELTDRRAGKGYDLAMVARRNGRELSHGNWQTIHFSFAEMIARASADVTLYPGDVIGSGTVGTGCILELGPENAGGWLQPGDVVELEIERLGILRNRIA